MPALSAFGASPLLIRGLTILLASIAVWGLGRFVASQVSPPAGVAAAAVLAVNPSFADQTAFDNGAVGVWMGALGLLFVALARYSESATPRRAFLVGLAAGFGIWARANFAWLLLSALAVSLPAALR